MHEKWNVYLSRAVVKFSKYYLDLIKSKAVHSIFETGNTLFFLFGPRHKNLYGFRLGQNILRMAY